MADLSARVTWGAGRAPLMPVAPTLIANIEGGERVLILSAVPVGQYTPLRPASMSEALHVVANTITTTWNHTGDVAFNASPDHADVTSYTARVRVSGSSTVVATQSLGTPTPDGNGVIVVSLTSTYAGLAAGHYTVSILATSAGGSTDSAESNVFSLPIA